MMQEMWNAFLVEIFIMGWMPWAGIAAVVTLLIVISRRKKRK